MFDAVPIEDAIAAVERAAKGIKSADARKQARDLIGAAAYLYRLRNVTMSASASLDRRATDEERIAAARVGAALDRARTP